MPQVSGRKLIEIVRTCMSDTISPNSLPTAVETQLYITSIPWYLTLLRQLVSAMCCMVEANCLVVQELSFLVQRVL